MNLTGLEEVDVKELLHSHGEDLTNEKLQELENQHAVEETEDAAAKEAPPTWNLIAALLAEGITKINEVLEMFSKKNSDWEHSSTVKSSILKCISCYRELLREKRLWARWSTLNAFFKNEPAVSKENEPQPGPSSCNSPSHLLSHCCYVRSLGVTADGCQPYARFSHMHW